MNDEQVGLGVSVVELVDVGLKVADLSEGLPS
jgi:hypothetical protein